MRKINSIVQDIMYATIDKKIKTSKHITLSITLKTLTSRRVIEICNKFGNCCSFNTIKELETEVNFYANSKSRIYPLNTVLQPGQ